MKNLADFVYENYTRYLPDVSSIKLNESPKRLAWELSSSVINTQFFFFSLL